MKTYAKLAAFAALGLAATAYAQARPDGRAMTRAEAQNKAEEMFAKMDANHDGKLEPADREARRSAKFDELDTNKDKQISKPEFMALRSRHAAMEGPAGPMGGPDHRGGGMGGRKHRGMGGPGHEMMMRMADTNRDGAISKDEFVAGALAQFDRADTNKDGTVTPEERRAAFAAMRQHMRDMRGNMAPPTSAMTGK